MKKMFWTTGAVLGILILMGSNNVFAEDAPQKGGCPGMAQKMGNPMQACFEKADTDKNGELSEAEFMECHKARFASMDADKNGSLSKDEMKSCCMMPKPGDIKPMEGKQCPHMKEGEKK